MNAAPRQTRVAARLVGLVALIGAVAVIGLARREGTAVGPQPLAEAPPLFGRRVGAVMIFDDGREGVIAVDPDARVAARSTVVGQRPGDQPYRLTRVGDHLVVGWGRVFAEHLATRQSEPVAEATIYVPAAEPGRIWLVDYPSGRIQGTPVVWQADLAGAEVPAPRPIDVAGFPALGITGGIALETEDGVALWEAASATVTRRLGTGIGLVADARAGALAWCTDPCSALHVTDLASGDDVAVSAPAAGTPPPGPAFDARAARFSPNGTSLAAIAGGDLVVIDPRSGAVRTVAAFPAGDPAAFIGWSPDGSKLFASSYSSGRPSTVLVVYDVAANSAVAARLPLGGALSFVVVTPDEAAAYLRDASPF